MSRNAVYIEDGGLEAWLDAFLPGWGDEVVPRSVRDVRVEVRVDDLRLWIKKRIDLVPYLRLCAYAPGVRVVLTNENFIEDQQVGRLFVCGEKWKGLFEEGALKKVVVLFGEGTMESGSRSEFHVVLWEKYMDLWGEDGGLGTERAKRWMEGLGFDEEMCEEVGGCFSVWLGRDGGNGLEKVMGLD
jgi:hypothetical protein